MHLPHQENDSISNKISFYVEIIIIIILEQSMKGLSKFHETVYSTYKILCSLVFTKPVQYAKVRII